MNADGAWPILAGTGHGATLRFSGISLALALAQDWPGRPLDGNWLREGIAASPGAAARLPIRETAVHAALSGADIALPHRGRESRDTAADGKRAE